MNPTNETKHLTEQEESSQYPDPSALNRPQPSDLRSFVLGGLLSGVLLGFAFLLEELHGLIWVATTPLFCVVRYRTPRGNFLAGWLAGSLCFLIACHWIRHVTILGWLALVLAEGTWLGLWMILAGSFRDRWRLFLFPAIWVSQELLRSKGVLGFSWNLLGHLSAPFEIHAQTWGVFGLSFLVACAGAALATIIAFFQHRDLAIRMPEGAGTLLGLPVVWLVLSWFLLLNVPQREGVISAGIVQGSFPQSLKWSVPVKEAVDRYMDLTANLFKRSEPDLVVWPEVAIPTVISQDPGLLNYLSQRLREWQTALLFGVLDEDRRQDTQGEFPPLFNSAILLDGMAVPPLQVTTPQQVGTFLRGEIGPLQKEWISLPRAYAMPDQPRRIYDKARLLPFGEYVPFRHLFPFIQDFVEKKGGGAFSSGPEGKVIATRWGDIGPLICFESTHPGLARTACLNGALLLVNMTNDAWFLQSAASRQHALQSRFRAIETGRAVLRAANTGISGVYLPNGNLAASLPPWQPSSAVFDIPLYSHLTLYLRVGDFAGWLCLITVVLALLLNYSSNHSEKDPVDDSPDPA